MVLAVFVFGGIALVFGPLAGLIATSAAMTTVCWRALASYSRRTFPYLGCVACKATGKDWEPKVLMWVCLRRRRRRWRKCKACDGTGIDPDS